MAVAELPVQAIALPRPSTSPAAYSNIVSYAMWVPLVAILMAIASLFYLAQTSEVANVGYSIQQLQAEQDDWTLRNEQLSLDLAKARSLATIDAQARGRLGMVPATNIVFLKPATTGGARPSPSVRGDARALPALERTTPASSDPLDSVRSSLSSLLVPRSQSPQR